jgi:hypothetical protein
VHVAARGVGVQPRVADARRRHVGDDRSGALGDPGRTAGREDLDDDPRPARPQVDVAVLVPGGEHRPVADVAEPVFGRDVLDQFRQAGADPAGRTGGSAKRSVSGHRARVLDVPRAQRDRWHGMIAANPHVLPLRERGTTVPGRGGRG